MSNGRRQPDRFALDLARFCPTCGNEIGICFVKETTEPDPHDVIEDELIKLSGEFDAESLIHWLGPNLAKGPSRRFHLEESEPLHEDLTKVDQQTEIKWFEKKYAKELTALRKVYDKIEMRWGFHQYFT